MAASFHVRQRLQRENLRLRRRLNMSRIKTEDAKREFLQFEIQQRRGENVLLGTTVDRIKQIYDLAPTVRRELPAATVTTELIREG